MQDSIGAATGVGEARREGRHGTRECLRHKTRECLRHKKCRGSGQAASPVKKRASDDASSTV